MASSQAMMNWVYPIIGFVIAIVVVLIVSTMSIAAAVSTYLVSAAVVMASLLTVYVLVLIAKGLGKI